MALAAYSHVPQVFHGHIHVPVDAQEVAELGDPLAWVVGVLSRTQPDWDRLVETLTVVVSYPHIGYEGQDVAVEVEELVESTVLEIGRWVGEVDRLGSSHRSVAGIGIHTLVEDTVEPRATVANHGRWTAETTEEDPASRSQPSGER